MELKKIIRKFQIYTFDVSKDFQIIKKFFQNDLYFRMTSSKFFDRIL